MRLVNDRLELSGTLVWMAACTVIAMQFTSITGALAVSAGAILGCLTARWAARRSAHLEVAITLCPFICALLLLACDGMHRSQLAGTGAGLVRSYGLTQILVWGGTAFCVSLALDLLRAEFPQAAAFRGVLVVASFANLFAAHHEFALLTGVVIASGTVAFCLANPQLTVGGRKYALRLAGLFPQGRLNPFANASN